MNLHTAFFATTLVVLSLAAMGQDAPQKELDRAKAIYATEKEAYRTSILEAFAKREDAARKSGDKKQIDQIKSERDAFENWHAVPSNVPPAVSKRRASSRTRMEAAYNTAIKASIRSKNDDAAAALEKELLAFRGDEWPHLELATAKFNGDAFQLNKGLKTVPTKREFSGPVEINVVARTEKDNIRLYAARGSCVIFNWEGGMGQLRVTRPDGQQDRMESGSLATATVTPLKPGVWYKLCWRINDDGMQVFVNDEVVFSEKKAYDLSTKSQISINAVESLIEVRDFHVVPITPTE